MADQLPASEELAGVLEFLRQAEALKNTLRSGYTSQGRPESAAEHSWRLALMALTLAPYFPDVNGAHLLKLCIVHDLGEALHGDIPAPQQTAAGAKAGDERQDLVALLAPLPQMQQAGLLALWDEYEAATTPAARLAKALDKLETILQHNQGDNPPDFDYAFNLHYGSQYTTDDPLIAEIRRVLDGETSARARSGPATPAKSTPRPADVTPDSRLTIVTGAPGAGKSTLVETLRRLDHDLLLFDMDDLLPAASALAGRDIRFVSDTWPGYNALWLSFLTSLSAQGRPVLLFAPVEPIDLVSAAVPDPQAQFDWLLLDCDDVTRRTRLAARPAWSDAMIEEALADARSLRSLISDRIDSGQQDAHALAHTLLAQLQPGPAQEAPQQEADAAYGTSDDYVILLQHEADSTVEEWLKQRIREFNNRHSPHHLRARSEGVEPLYALVRSADGELLGGLAASTYWQWLDIDDLWLAPALRGQGLGRRLLVMAEAEAQRRGCVRAQLRTFDFQARGFYAQAGYRMVGMLEDYPPEGAMYWMRKDFRIP